MTGTPAAASRRWRWAGRSSAPITAMTACWRRSATRRGRRSPTATRSSRATGRWSRSSRSGRPSGAMTGSPEMADNDKVDALIIGSGASGAAVAWSLAETKMRILCLEQGDWVRSTEFPTNGRDWEARRYTDFDISPNRRGRDTDYPVNDDNAPMKIDNINGAGGRTGDD